LPRTKKQPGTAVDKRNGRRTELEGGVRLTYFPCPLPRASAAALATWEMAWTDPVHDAWTPADGPILVRYIEHWERAQKAARRADRKPVVLGSVGQPAEHPSYSTMARSISVVERCEQLLGLGALNREKLGLTIADRQISLADLNARFAGGDDDDEPDARLG
jgi:hypothetical protein